ncbi:MFS transporter [Nonomuraea sp. 3N208]|uniref:MFS transporter n=1 Tax=Nonomuraea sp. 3N208 TaxID=3457421 RepID=UPI003FD2B786
MTLQPAPGGAVEPTGELRTRSDWTTIVIVYVAGVITAMSLGKFASVGPMMTAQLDLSLSQLGWVISAVVGVTAIAGLPGGYAVRRLGAARSLVTGLVLMAASVPASLAAPDFAWLLALRCVEGVGYLLVIVAAPVLVLRLAGERDRGAALAIWATFVPVGLAVSTLAGGVLGSTLGWRGWVGLLAGLTLVMAPAVWLRLPRGSTRQPEAGGVLRPGALAWPGVLAAGFCLMVLVTVPAVVLLPTLLIEQYGRPAAAAGAITSVISLLSALGGVGTGILIRRGARVSVLALSGLLTLPAAWLLYGGDDSLAAALTGAGVIWLVNGFFGALAFAALPLVLARLDDADVGNGLLAQLGSLGSLLGPPLFGLVAAGADLQPLVLVVAAGMLAATGSMLLVGRRDSPRIR